ncbi:MAG: peptide chain release factor N(5)-glutamine methyltransferase, partial [Burkholderiaceae bacterium]
PTHEQWALLERATGRPRSWFLARKAHDWWPSLLPGEAALLLRLAQSRLAGRPLAHVLGWREFYGRRFWVTPDVLIPRAETEGLVAAGLDCLAERDSEAWSVLDLGTGSGCVGISLALEAPGAAVTLSDQSQRALSVARLNAACLGAPVHCCVGSWFQAPPAGERFDLIVANPPYVAEDDPHLRQGDLPYEPMAALAGLWPNPTGLDDLSEIVSLAPARLKPHGWLVVEHGHDQQQAVMALAHAAGFARVEGLSDLAGVPRLVQAQL